MKLSYTIAELARIFGTTIYRIANDLASERIKPWHDSKEADLSRWTGGIRRRGNEIFINTSYFDDPDPNEVTVPTSRLSESWIKAIEDAVAQDEQGGSAGVDSLSAERELQKDAVPPSATPPKEMDAIFQPWDEPGLGKRERQIRLIEAVIDELGFERMAVPDGEKNNIWEVCKRKSSELFGPGWDPFKAAWQKGVSHHRFRMASHEKFSRR